MSIFNSQDPRIATAQQTYLDTLADLGVAYDAAEILPDLADYRTGELVVAVRGHTIGRQRNTLDHSPS